MKSGICTSMGRQLPYIFTPSTLYSSIISAFMSARLGSVALKLAYFFFMASTLCWMRIIFNEDFSII